MSNNVMSNEAKSNKEDVLNREVADFLGSARANLSVFTGTEYSTFYSNLIRKVEKQKMSVREVEEKDIGMSFSDISIQKIVPAFLFYTNYLFVVLNKNGPIYCFEKQGKNWKSWKICRYSYKITDKSVVGVPFLNKWNTSGMFEHAEVRDHLIDCLANSTRESFKTPKPAPTVAPTTTTTTTVKPTTTTTTTTAKPVENKTNEPQKVKVSR